MEQLWPESQSMTKGNLASFPTLGAHDILCFSFCGQNRTMHAYMRHKWKWPAGASWSSQHEGIITCCVVKLSPTNRIAFGSLRNRDLGDESLKSNSKLWGKLSLSIKSLIVCE